MRFLGHPVHPPSTHLPLGLLLTIPLWDGAAQWQAAAGWSFAAFWCLALGLVFAAPAAVTGFMDFLALEEGHPGLPDLWRHMGIMAAALSVDLASLLVRGGTDPLTGGRFAWAAGLSALGAAVLGVGGWYGGHLVYKHRIGLEGRGDE